MTAPQTMITGILEWVQEVIPELVGVYDFDPAGRPRGLPDVVGVLDRTEITIDTSEFPGLGIQQGFLHRVATEISIMAEATPADIDDPESVVAAQEAATHTLRGWEVLLVRSKLEDATLGGRVPFVSPYHHFDFRPSYVQFGDGTRGHEVRASIVAGEIVEVH